MSPLVRGGRLLSAFLVGRLILTFVVADDSLPLIWGWGIRFGLLFSV